MTSLYVKLIVRAIMNFPGSHGYSIIKNLLALPIARIRSDVQFELVGFCLAGFLKPCSIGENKLSWHPFAYRIEATFVDLQKPTISW